ncbi:hypothetical protein ACFO60_07720 [Sphaerisporangium dianthi]|uniref:Uncharacterized protein n=1 Tax=Sphaerisporangium dianthi TaxID=1436120 RepID=A0ABV9CD13_9ACTN
MTAAPLDLRLGGRRFGPYGPYGPCGGPGGGAHPGEGDGYGP